MSNNHETPDAAPGPDMTHLPGEEAPASDPQAAAPPPAQTAPPPEPLDPPADDGADAPAFDVDEEGAESDEPFDPAEGEEFDPLAALTGGSSSAPADGEFASADGEFAAATDDFVPVGTPIDPALSAAAGNGMTPAQRAARARQTDRRATNSFAHQYQKTMVPVLLVTGVLLLVLGTLVLFLYGGGPAPEEGEPTGINLGLLAAIAAYPVGLVLLVGAWFFHRETSGPRR